MRNIFANFGHIGVSLLIIPKRPKRFGYLKNELLYMPEFSRDFKIYELHPGIYKEDNLKYPKAQKEMGIFARYSEYVKGDSATI